MKCARKCSKTELLFTECEPLLRAFLCFGQALAAVFVICDSDGVGKSFVAYLDAFEDSSVNQLTQHSLLLVDVRLFANL